MQELLTAKSRSAALRQQIVRFNEELKHTGQETLKTGHELQRHKAARRNINAAVVVLSQCRELTSLMATAKQQIEVRGSGGEYRATGLTTTGPGPSSPHSLSNHTHTHARARISRRTRGTTPRCARWTASRTS